MKYARYKYNTSLNKWERRAPDAQENHILTLRVELNTIKSKARGIGSDSFPRSQKRAKAKLSSLTSKKDRTTKSRNIIPHDYSW